MDRQELERRLKAVAESGGSGAAESVPDDKVLEGVMRMPAAVLIGLVGRPDGTSLILTHRTDRLRDHPGEISLPGGRMEAGDDGPVDAALREACEEIGLTPRKVEILGLLPQYQTISGYCVTPVVGWIEPPVTFRPDPNEVAEVFEVPLDYVLDPANHRQESITLDGVDHTFYVLPYPGHRIWGATAGMLVRFARSLSG